MIISKPKTSTLSSIGIFIALVFALIWVTFNSINNSDSIYWYHYLFLTLLIPTGTGVLLKIILGYKIISFGKGWIRVKKPVKFSNIKYDLRNIEQWKEVKIKTATGLYRQVEIYFKQDKKIVLSQQEYTSYEKVLKYLEQKAGKKKVT